MLYSRTLLFIHPIYNSLHLLIPNSHSSPWRNFNVSLSLALCLAVFIHWFDVKANSFLAHFGMWDAHPSLSQISLPNLEPRQWAGSGCPGNRQGLPILYSTQTIWWDSRNLAAANITLDPAHVFWIPSCLSRESTPHRGQGFPALSPE